MCTDKMPRIEVVSVGIRAGFLEKVELGFHVALQKQAPQSLLFPLMAALESHLKIMGHWR